MTLDEFNSLNETERATRLYDCCACSRWSVEVSHAAPFASREALKQTCLQKWATATEQEILEAFSGHPQIGDMAALRNKYAHSANREQGQILQADEDVLKQLNAGNQKYLERFGFIFIVCATGKSAAEMLELLNARIDNSREVELANGAREQAAIMLLRIDQLVLPPLKEGQRDD